MVYLDEKIIALETLLEDVNLASLCYFYVAKKDRLGTVNISTFSNSPQELFSAKGFLSMPVLANEIEIANRPGYKGVDITSTIFKLIGAYLASPITFEAKLKEKFDNTSLRNKFLISKCIPTFTEEFKRRAIVTDSNNPDSIFSLLVGSLQFSEQFHSLIANFKLHANDVIDLMILHDLNHLFASNSLVTTKLLNVPANQLVESILNNFENAVQKIKVRRKDHPPFQINDEYDVQDILYVVLKSVFPLLKEEDPTPRVGFKSNRIDLIIREEGILVEVKMIKASDSNEREFVEELKTDIQSYHQSQWLKHLFCFVYDPMKKTRDVQNFYDLNGEQTINGVTFSIQVIVIG